jgi:restriction system protein
VGTTNASRPVRQAGATLSSRFGEVGLQPGTQFCEHRDVTGAAIPQYHKLMWPVQTGLTELGGSATLREMYERVVENEHFTEEQQSVSTNDGRISEIEYRLHWARTHLKAIGAIENSTRGVWTVTDKGRAITSDQMQAQTKA